MLFKITYFQCKHICCVRPYVLSPHTHTLKNREKKMIVYTNLLLAASSQESIDIIYLHASRLNFTADKTLVYIYRYIYKTKKPNTLHALEFCLHFNSIYFQCKLDWFSFQRFPFFLFCYFSAFFHLQFMLFMFMRKKNIYIYKCPEDIWRKKTHKILNFNIIIARISLCVWS